MASAAAKNKLREVEGRISQLRDERAEHQREVDEAREAYATHDGEVGIDSPEFKAVEDAVRKLGTADDELADRQQEQITLLRAIGGSAPSTDGTPKPDTGSRTMRGWNSGALFADDVVEALQKASTSKGRLGGIELGEVLSAEDLAGGSMTPIPSAAVPDVEPTGVERRGPFRGVLPELRRPLSVLDLIPTGTMEMNSFQYVREESFSGEGKPNAKGTKEGETKPQASVKFTDAEAVARTIAEYMKLKKQALADVPALRTTIDSRLRYFIERALEDQILSGKGVDPELEGILKVSGLGVVKYAAGVLAADQTLKAITSVLLANARATGIVMNPLDWQEVLIAKAIAKVETTNLGSAEYYSGGPFSITPQVMWGIPLVPSPAIAQGNVLVGDFQIGSQLLIREGIQVLMSDSDQDDFVKNRVTLLGETRAAHVIWRPTAYTVVYLSKAAEEAA